MSRGGVARTTGVARGVGVLTLRVGTTVRIVDHDDRIAVAIRDGVAVLIHSIARGGDLVVQRIGLTGGVGIHFHHEGERDRLVAVEGTRSTIKELVVAVTVEIRVQSRGGGSRRSGNAAASGNHTYKGRTELSGDVLRKGDVVETGVSVVGNVHFKGHIDVTG